MMMQDKTGTTPSRPNTGPLLSAHYGLPVHLTPLIGRERELEEICALLRQPELRLLTLSGPGGVGKTRLGLAAAQAVLEDFADGVCFVPLAPVSDSTRVITAIAQALGLVEAGDLPLEVQVRAALRDRHLLLLLDNFEHVVEAASSIYSLLISCPLLSILVTSRANLHLSGESVFVVSPLMVPDLAHLPDAQTLARMPAVQLFVLRAQAIQPTFHLTPANASAIAEICKRLDGLPLALELAATRIKLLPPQALLKRLERRLTVLTGGAHDLPVRQQTLRDTIQWSYDLLRPEEQHLFCWLSIFVGGCSLEAAEAVCRARNDQALPALDAITSLLDKSLVQSIEREGEQPRLVMLETIREFGLERLQQQGELQAASRAHADYCLELAEQAEPHLTGPEQVEWLHLLDQERDNLLASLRWTATGGDEELQLALRLGCALKEFWIRRGYLSEGRGLLEQCLARDEVTNLHLYLKALEADGRLAWFQSDHRRVEQVAQQYVLLAQKAQAVPLDDVDLLFTRGLVALAENDAALARLLFEEGLMLARARKLPLLGFLLMNLGRLALSQQEEGQAVQFLEESVRVNRAEKHMTHTAISLYYLAHALYRQGEFARARALLEEDLALCREGDHRWAMASVLHMLGLLALQQGEMSQAQAFLTEGARLAQEVGDQRNLVHSRLLLAALAALRGDLALARLWCEEGLSSALDLGDRDLTALALKELGCVAASQGFPRWAAVLWGAAEPLGESPHAAVPSALYEPIVAMVRSQSGESAFSHALAAGRAMTPTQALAAQQSFLPPHPSHLPEDQSAPGAASISPTHPPSYPAGLTSREVEVLRLLAQGCTGAQIAEQLTISHRTVTTHLTSIYNKLGVNSRVAATRFALEHHLA